MNDIATADQHSLASQEQPLPPDNGAMSLLAQAVQHNAQPEQIDKLIELVKFHDQREALRAFNQAFTAAQGEFPQIKKTREVDFSTNKGRTYYTYAAFKDIVEAVRPVLQKHSLSFRHEVKEDDGRITVRCILAHAAGHSESAVMSGPVDTSGNKNSIQGVGSSVTYLKRYTLEAVTGVVTTNDDTDGNTGSADTIDENQVADLDSKIQEVGADKAAFLKFAKVNKLEDIHPNAYPALIRKLEQKRKSGATQ